MQVYVDESERRDYLLGVTTVVGPVQPLRAALRALLRPGQRRIHFAKEQDSRRRQRKHGSNALEYRRLSPYEEPLLWVSDAVAWAMGAGGDWRRRIDPILDEVVRLGR